MIRYSVLVACAAFAVQANACSVMGKISGSSMVESAEVIVRATAAGYETAPANPNRWTTGTPDSMIHFEVVETLRGEVLKEISIAGYLTEGDDFNDQRPPYNFVRPGGRRGSCFANTYRAGAQYLLALIRNQSGQLTPYWYALGPANEQLHSDQDPWLLWVREKVRTRPGK